VAFLPWLLGPISVYRGVRSWMASLYVAAFGAWTLYLINFGRIHQGSGGPSNSSAHSVPTVPTAWLVALLVTPFAIAGFAHLPPLPRWFVPCRTVAWALLWSVPVASLVVQASPQNTMFAVIATWVLAAAVIGGPAALITIKHCNSTNGCPVGAGLIGGAWGVGVLELVGTVLSALALALAADSMPEKSEYSRRQLKFRVMLIAAFVMHTLAIATLIGLCVYAVFVSLGGLLGLIVPIIVCVMIPLCVVMGYSGWRTAVRKATSPDQTFQASLLSSASCICCMLCCLVAVFLGILGLAILNANPYAHCCKASSPEAIIFCLLIVIVAILGVFDWFLISYETNEEHAVVESTLVQVLLTDGLVARLSR